MSDITTLCSICGKFASNVCKLCGKHICGEHYDANEGICSSCKKGKR